MTLFLIADTHFGHSKACSFLDKNNQRIRPWDSVEEMDEAMVQNGNKVVGPKDTVYHLGDVVIPRKSLSILSRLNGKKALVRGNHDIYKLSDYSPYFYDIRGAHVKDRYLMTHIPCHRDSVSESYIANIHGHLHCNTVTKDGEPDPLYFCVCVEQIDFTPIPWEVVRDRLQILS